VNKELLHKKTSITITTIQTEFFLSVLIIVLNMGRKGRKCKLRLRFLVLVQQSQTVGHDMPANKSQMRPSMAANSTQCTDLGTGPHTDQPYSGHLTPYGFHFILHHNPDPLFHL
jgi:hypothetical protein